MTELEVAERIARVAHAGQKDTVTGDDYITHVQRVVCRCVSHEARMTAWLHDVIEDCPFANEAELRASGIPEPVIKAVVLLTRDKSLTYAAYIGDILASGNRLAIEVKIADLRDHLSLNGLESLRQRYEKALAVLTGGAA